MRATSSIPARLPACLALAFALALALAGPLRAETDVEKAALLVKARSWPEAQALLERTVQADPRNAEALALLGEVQLATRHPEKAVEYADKAIRLDPEKARYHLLRGNAYGAQAQAASFLKALTLAGDIRGSYEKAVRLEPANRPARFALFSFYLIAPGVVGGGLGKARTFAGETQALDPSRGHYMMGRVLQAEKNPGAALAEYRLAQEADPQWPSIYNDLGYLELQSKQVDLALAHFQKQAELDPGNANSYDSLGDGWTAKGRTDEAIAAYRRALELNPLFFSSMRSLGSALEKAGRRDEAIEHYRRCAKLGAERGVPEVVKESNARLKALGVPG